MSQIDRVLRSNLRLRHLQLLVALDEFRHLGRAADFLALTQPALAAALREKGLARTARCTWERTARETMVVYKQVLAGR